MTRADAYREIQRRVGPLGIVTEHDGKCLVGKMTLNSSRRFVKIFSFGKTWEEAFASMDIREPAKKLRKRKKLLKWKAKKSVQMGHDSKR